MKQPIIHTGVIDSLSHEGRGITRWQEKVVFVEDALPGEEVEWELLKRRSGFDLARAVKVLSAASPDRTVPCCPHYQQCGGCSLQHMRPEVQLRFKQQALSEQFAHHLKIKELPWVAPITSCDTCYRRKARIGIKYLYKKERLIIGFHERRGRYLADVESCPILHTSVGEHIEELRELLKTLAVFDQIPQIEIAVGDNGTFLVLRVLAPLTEQDKQLLIDFSQKQPDKFYFYLQTGDLSSVTPLVEGQEAPNYLLPSFGLTMQFSPVGFIQINGEVNRKLVDRVVEWMDPKPQDKIIDLFCGIGNFTLPLAKMGAQLIGIEGESSAVDYAKLNARINDITNASFEVMDLSDPDKLQSLVGVLASADKLLLDPPRTGAAELIAFIADLLANNSLHGPHTIVYVSCNPATLVRDCVVLASAGYQIAKIGIADMYPHTAHVETVVLMSHIQG